MKVLIQKKEIVDFLTDSTANIFTPAELSRIKDVPFVDDTFQQVMEWAKEKRAVRKLEKFKDKFHNKLLRSIEADLTIYVNNVKTIIDEIRESKIKLVSKHADYILNKFDPNELVHQYSKCSNVSFTKSLGQLIDPACDFVFNINDINPIEDCLFRNMSGNEHMLLTKMENNYPFWFIDTGYTNFLNDKKKTWHRLTRNHLHHYIPFEAPVNRLNNFETFPLPWRESGDKILVIEPGEFSANTFKIDIKKWKYNVEKTLRKYTEKPIIFREKLSKKTRCNLYTELLNDDYYCVININSNAAVESIWAGVPVITLHKHISNSVSRNKLSDINNLTKPQLANWLCMLSYSQFTFDELTNGTALNIVKKYHV